MQATWHLSTRLTDAQARAFEGAGIDRGLAQLLFNRGIRTPEHARLLLDARYEHMSDPLGIVDMSRAVERITQALERGEHITVFGDYDADGVTATALLLRALRRVQLPGSTLSSYIPHRREGYGLSVKAIDALRGRGTTLIIAVDCGSSDVEAVAHATAYGMDVVIADHHLVATTMPAALALVNPNRLDASGSNEHGEQNLSGVGISFKLAQALYRATGRLSEADEEALLDMVAVGTVADVVPLQGENHTLVRLGLQRLNAAPLPGLKALIDGAGLRRGHIRERDIAFMLAPRLNAAGRMAHADSALRLLTTDLPEEAERYADELNKLNSMRQQETDHMVQLAREQAMHQADNPLILVSGENWHEGIIGLVSGKLAEEMGRPVLVVSIDPRTKLGRGSARSREDFSIIAALRDCSPLLERYGGHAHAAGFTVRCDRLEAFHSCLLAWASKGSQGGIASAREHAVDIELAGIGQLTPAFYAHIRTLAPFGKGFPEPTFKVGNLRLLEAWGNTWGRSFRLRLESSDGCWRGLGTISATVCSLETLKSMRDVSVVFQIEERAGVNGGSIQLRVLHMAHRGESNGSAWHQATHPDLVEPAG